MVNLSTLFQGGIIAAFVTLITLFLYSKNINNKLKAEARHLDNQDISIYTESAKTLIEPLRAELENAQKETKELRIKVKELTRDIEAQSLLVTELTEKLERANKKAEYFENEAKYYQNEFARIIGSPAIRRKESNE